MVMFGFSKEQEKKSSTPALNDTASGHTFISLSKGFWP